MPNTKNTHRYHPNTHSRGIPVIVRTHTLTTLSPLVNPSPYSPAAGFGVGAAYTINSSQLIAIYHRLLGIAALITATSEYSYGENWKFDLL